MTEKRADIMQSDTSLMADIADYPQWLKERLDWFMDLKFGFFMHWGLYSQWGCIESWPLVEADTWARPDNLAKWNECGRDLEKFRAGYRALNKTFNPTRFNPEAWAEEAKRMGTKYVCFTTKHHDGFCLWDTKTTAYRITHESCPFHTNPRRDVVKEVFDAFRAQKFAASCYFSKSDWHCPWYWKHGQPAHDRNPNFDTKAEPQVWEQFVQFVHAQVRELMQNYGPFDLLWLDGGQVRAPMQDIRMDEMAALARSYQPGLIMVDRTVGNAHENIVTPEQEIPDKPLGRPWETCMTLGHGWGYVPDDDYKSPRTIVHMLLDVVAKGGNFLVNVGPTPDGEMPPRAVAIMREIGAWLEINGEAIYGTRPIAPYAEGQIRYTRKGKKIFACILAEEGKEAPPAKVRLSGLLPAKGSQVRMLGQTQPLAWSMVGNAAEVEIPATLPCKHAWALEYELA